MYMQAEQNNEVLTTITGLVSATVSMVVASIYN